MLGVVVHAIDTAKRPDQPAGFRWAIHLGDNWRSMSTCLNAGWAPTESEAILLADLAAVVGAKVAKFLCGESWYQSAVVIDYDPQPTVSADTTPIMGVSL